MGYELVGVVDAVEHELGGEHGVADIDGVLSADGPGQYVECGSHLEIPFAGVKRDAGDVGLVEGGEYDGRIILFQGERAAQVVVEIDGDRKVRQVLRQCEYGETHRLGRGNLRTVDEGYGDLLLRVGLFHCALYESVLGILSVSQAVGVERINSGQVVGGRRDLEPVERHGLRLAGEGYVESGVNGAELKAYLLVRHLRGFSYEERLAHIGCSGDIARSRVGRPRDIRRSGSDEVVEHSSERVALVLGSCRRSDTVEGSGRCSVVVLPEEAADVGIDILKFCSTLLRGGRNVGKGVVSIAITLSVDQFGAGRVDADHIAFGPVDALAAVLDIAGIGGPGGRVVG